MRNLHYKPRSFRLNEKTVENLKKIRRETGLSYNQIITEMIRSYFKKLEKRRKVQENQNR
jgi:predicted DNA-binding protein